MTLTRFVGKNAFRNKRRSILTVLSIGFSLLLLTLMMTLWRAFYLDEGSAESAQRVVVRHRVSLTFNLPGFYREKIRSVPGVVAEALTRRLERARHHGGLREEREARDRGHRDAGIVVMRSPGLEESTKIRSRKTFLLSLARTRRNFLRYIGILKCRPINSLHGNVIARESSSTAVWQKNTDGSWGIASFCRGPSIL